MHEVEKRQSIAERWAIRSGMARLGPEGRGIPPPPPEGAVRRVLEYAGRKRDFILSENSRFFILGGRGFRLNPAAFVSSVMIPEGVTTEYSSELRLLPADDTGSAAFY